jgi:hypothetical protein
MKAPIHPIRYLAALAFFALAACQTSPESGDLSVGSTTVTEQDAELRLVVRDDSTCLELRDRILAGEAGDSLKTAFIIDCVIEVPPPHPLPPRLVPTPGQRCEWVAVQIDSGRTGLVRHFIKHCPDVCDSLAAAPDSAAYAK